MKAVVGPGGYIEGEAESTAYTRPWRGMWDGRSPLILRPRTAEEGAAIVKICAESGTPIVPQGGNTGVGAATPDAKHGKVVVSTARMSGSRDRPGQQHDDGRGRLHPRESRGGRRGGRLFPLSLGAEGSCQIGGNISTNAGGIERGALRQDARLVLGLEVVLPDGRVWDGLRGLRKDNTGYDLKQLFIGAEGTLGIITAAVLELFPQPHRQRTALAAIATRRPAVELLALMRRARRRASPPSS